MKTKLLLMLMISAVSFAFLSAQDVKMKKVFNGKDLKGWVEPEGNIWWTASKGVMNSKSDPDKKGSILWTAKTYTDFIIELDFKMGDGTVDSGIFLRSENAQIQIGISGSLKRDMTASPYIPGKSYPVEASGVKEQLKTDDWNTLKVMAKGKEYTAWLNGQKVMSYTDEEAIAEGPVGLQLHPGKDMEIDFRNIRMGVL